MPRALWLSDKRRRAEQQHIVTIRREGRPQLNALMAAARNREIDCVLVWKFDRFARSTRHLLAALEEFNHLGVRFVSVQDQVDTDSPMGRAMFTIIGAMAELESSLISERVTAGMRAAETRENTWAGPPPNSASCVKSRHLPRQRTSAFAKFKAKLLVGQAEDWSERSPSAPASNLPRCASPTSLEQTIRHEQSNDAAATKR